MATPVRRRPRLGRWLAGAAVLFALLGAGALAGAWNAGYGAYVVHTGSMAPTMPSGDLVLTRAGATYGVGDVITFEHGAGPTDLVTHRITAITAQGISTKGDANRTADAWTIAPSEVHGVEVSHLPRLGYVAYFLQQPAGVAGLLTSVLAVIALWGLFFPPARPAPAWRGAFVPVERVRRPAASAAVGGPAWWSAG